MNRKKILEEIKGYFVNLVTEIRTNTALDHYDINRMAEDFFVPILGKVYSCPDLKNLNLEMRNYPAVDLGSDQKRISFQITSTANSARVSKALEFFINHTYLTPNQSRI